MARASCGGSPESGSLSRSASHWPWPREWRSRRGRRRRCASRRSRMASISSEAPSTAARRMAAGGGYGDDGMLHEAGDVAVRVTSEGADCRRQQGTTRTSPTCSAQIKSVTESADPIRAQHPPSHRSRRRRRHLHQNHRDHRAPQRAGELPPQQAAGRAAVSCSARTRRCSSAASKRGPTISAAATPTATPSSTSRTCPAIDTGDLITEGMPVLDYRNGASAVEWVKVLDEILKLDFDVVIPGHGPLLTRKKPSCGRIATSWWT